MALIPTPDELAAELKVFIPKVGRWKLETSCSICGIEFNYIRGRHHCRYCGASVCGRHSKNRAVVPSSMSTEKQRVCDLCYPKCQYGIPHQRQCGFTTASGRRGNFTLLDFQDTDDPRMIKTERGRARTMMRDHLGNDRGYSPRRLDDVWTTQSWQTPEARSPSNARRRGLSEPPERSMKFKAPPAPPQTVSPRRNKFKPLPPSPPSVSPRKKKQFQFDDNVQDDVFQFSPPKHHKSPQPMPSKHKSKKTLSIRKQTAPPPPPPFKPFKAPANHSLDASDFGASFAAVRDTTEQDAIAMQYLSSFIKTENLAATTAVTVSHECAGGPPAIEALVEMKPASPKELQQVPELGASQITGNSKAQNRKMSSSSTCTVSVSDSEDLEEEKPASANKWEGRSTLDEGASVLITADHPDHQFLADLPTVEVASVKDVPSRPVTLSVQFAIDSPKCKSEDEREQLFAEIMELEKQIHQCQSELPAMIEEWRRVQHIAACLRADAADSRDKVLQYQKARAVVSRAIRMATKCMRESEHEAAILELSRAVAIERTNPKIWYMLAECRFKVGQLEEAEDACRASVELQHSAVGVALLGRILYKLGRHDEAIQCYLTALGR